MRLAEASLDASGCDKYREVVFPFSQEDVVRVRAEFSG
jgi:hypothetical protein